MTDDSGRPVRLRECHDCRRYTHTAYSRCDDCRFKRRASDRKRRAVSRILFGAELRGQLLQQLRKGRPLGEACLILQVSTPQVHSFARINPWFRIELDQALMKGRNPDLDHGTESSYRIHRCRCPECRRGRAKRR